MIIFVYKGFTRNPEIGNIPVWILPNINIWRHVRNNKFGINLFNEKLLSAANYKDYIVQRFRINKGKPTGDKITPSQIRVNNPNESSRNPPLPNCNILDSWVLKILY